MCLAACLARRLFPKLTRAFVSPLSAERDQQLDMATRVCEALVRRLRETERTLATADADRAERSELLEAEVQTDEAELLTSTVVAPPAAPTLRSLLGLPMLRVAAARLLLPLHLLHWVLPNMPLVSPLLQRLTQGLAPAGAAVESAGAPGAEAVGAAGTAELEASTDDRMGREEDEDEDEEADEDVEDADEDVAMEEEDGDEEEDDDEEEDEEGDEDEDEGDDEDDDEDDEDEEEDEEDEDMDEEDEEAAIRASIAARAHDNGAGAASAAAASALVARAATAAESLEHERQAAEVVGAVAATQAAILSALELPTELIDQIVAWERQQTEAEGEWRLKQSRMHLEFEERKRRLQEQQLGQRKKLRESCDAALRPTYETGSSVCVELERRLVGKLCRLCEHRPPASSRVPQDMLPGPLARIRAINFGQLDAPLRAPNCPSTSRSVGVVPVSSGILVTLEKLSDRNGIAMLPAAEDPLDGFSRSGRGQTEFKLPLRLLGARVRVLSEAEAQAATRAANERIFVVRYAGGEHGGPIEPVQILPEGLSLAEYDISFAAGAAAMRVEHRLDGPVRCRAEPAAQKQVFSETPVELYTQEVDAETHNIVQVYFSDLRDEVAVDVLNLTGTETSLDDEECCAFPPDATGAALNYKIIVRDGSVVAVLYQEGDDVRPSPFIEHKLPSAGAFVTLADGSLGKLGALPRGLIVTRAPTEMPENAPLWPPMRGLRPKGKHPAELPGMIDLQVLQTHGQVAWPPTECSVPVCAITPAESSRLREWHAMWDNFVNEKRAAAGALADRIEELLARGLKPRAAPAAADAAVAPTGADAENAPPAISAKEIVSENAPPAISAKEIVSTLTEMYGSLEERQREMGDLEVEGIGEERLQAIKRGIQRFAALARFG